MLQKQQNQIGKSLKNLLSGSFLYCHRYRYWLFLAIYGSNALRSWTYKAEEHFL